MSAVDNYQYTFISVAFKLSLLITRALFLFTPIFPRHGIAVAYLAFYVLDVHWELECMASMPWVYSCRRYWNIWKHCMFHQRPNWIVEEVLLLGSTLKYLKDLTKTQLEPNQLSLSNCPLKTSWRPCELEPESLGSLSAYNCQQYH